MRTMVERGWLGEKTGAASTGRTGREILALDWKTLEYRERRKAKFALGGSGAQSVEDLGARLRQIMGGKDKAAQFLDRVLSATCLYAASLVPEISDDVVVGRPRHGVGLRAGARGPFRLLDALGRGGGGRAGEGGGPRRSRRSSRRCWRPAASASTRRRATRRRSSARRAPLPLPDRPGVLDLAAVKARGGLVKKNAGASLLDLGDGVRALEFHSKMNALGSDADRHARDRGEGGRRALRRARDRQPGRALQRRGQPDARPAGAPRRRSGTSWTSSSASSRTRTWPSSTRACRWWRRPSA